MGFPFGVAGGIGSLGWRWCGGSGGGGAVVVRLGFPGRVWGWGVCPWCACVVGSLCGGGLFRLGACACGVGGAAWFVCLTLRASSASPSKVYPAIQLQ